MKRYKLIDTNREYPSDIGEDLNGDLVKYEPWMDLIDEIIIDNPGGNLSRIVINGDKIPQVVWKDNSLEIVNSKPKDSTICVRCENILNDVLCQIRTTDFVHGGEKFPICADKNHGSCPDFAPKE